MMKGPNRGGTAYAGGGFLFSLPRGFGRRALGAVSTMPRKGASVVYRMLQLDWRRDLHKIAEGFGIRAVLAWVPRTLQIERALTFPPCGAEQAGLDGSYIRTVEPLRPRLDA
jgi:hypothetical protein